jgi:two-component system sensor histidine kinase RegB
LGTPLATMGVLAGELRRDPALPAEAREDLELLCRQVALCKEIVGGLTQKAGIARAGSAGGVPADAWLEGLLARWRTLWPQATCVLAVVPDAGAPPVVVPPAALDQAVTNLLNNAARYAPLDMRLALAWEDGLLRIAVHDRGAGFPPEILRCCGAEPVAAHAQGSGIGLWLTRAAVERLGGRLRLENTPTGGMAAIELPLASLMPATTKEMD